DGWSVGSSPEITANWIASGGKWTVPVGGGFGKAFHLSGQAMKLDFNAFYNAIRPKAGNDTWLLQVKLTFQFPACNPLIFQKGCDGGIHEQYLRPLAGRLHRPVFELDRINPSADRIEQCVPASAPRQYGRRGPVLRVQCGAMDRLVVGL